jgi:GT2 family glycosyltransferase
MIAVIVLNWNNGPDTLECLASVYQSEGTEYVVYVVDNGSTDGSLALIRTSFPHARFIENRANLGFAEGNNRAIQEALRDKIPYILLLNNDAVVRRDTLALMKQGLERFPRAAALGPKIYHYDEPTRIWYAGADFDRESARFFHNDWGVEEAKAPARPAGPTGYVCGCAMLLRAQAIMRVGLMDARYFLNWEEIDWCARFQKAGYDCIYDPAPKVWHKIGRSFVGGKRGPMWHYYYWRNRLLWMRQHLPLRDRWHLYRTAIGPEIRTLIRERRDPIASASLWGVADYFLRRFGRSSLYHSGSKK